MNGRVSVKELLVAGVLCSSESVRSGRGWGSGGERVGAGGGADGCGEGQGGAEVVENRRKRKGEAVEGGNEVKRVKVESRGLQGRLLLWNRAESSHPGAGLNSLDCLAFYDGSVAVCCTVQSLDVGLLGQPVQVNSWTFIPASKSSDKLCHAEDGSAGCDVVTRLTGTESDENATVEGILGDERVFFQYSGCGGYLEIHSLKPLDEPSASTPEEPDFPSLCLCPAAANARNLVLESPLQKIGRSKPRLRGRGFLHSISPSFLIPSSSSLHHAPVTGDSRSLPGQILQKSVFKGKSISRPQSDRHSILGFLIELRPCCHGSRCQLNHNSNAPGTLSHRPFPEQEVVDAGEDCPVAIYFSGAVAAWRPVLGEMLGGCIAVNGLRRKMIRLCPEKKEFCIFVATRTSLVFCIRLPVADANSKSEAAGFSKYVIRDRLRNQTRDRVRHLRGFDGSDGAASSKQLRFQLHSKVVPDGEALGKAGQGLRSYVGKITSILMEGRLLELDDKVWLLLTHFKHTQIHGLRVGALVAVRHSHVMTLRSLSENVLVLGACLRSHVWVVLHSISNAGSPISQASQSRLSKYIGSLTFSWAFWAIHVVVSLLRKLQGAYSCKELLGSMKHAGLLRKILPSMMGTPVTLHRDAFKEFLLHDQFCLLGDTSASVLLPKVPPLSNFCKYVEMLWFDRKSLIWHEGQMNSDAEWDPGARFWQPLVSQTSCYVRNIISGAKLGVVLVGALKVCQSTGKLQLVDATGACDVVVPDLRSLSNLQCVYQIAKYKLVMEGEYKAPDFSAAGKNINLFSPISWSSLLKGSTFENRIPQSPSYYVKFYLRYAKGLEGLTWPSQFQSHESEAAMDLLSTSDVTNDLGDAWKGKEFNVALITHKYPARMKYSPDKEKQWAFDVEVVLLPYNLLVHQDNNNCGTTPTRCLQTFDLSSSSEQGAIGSLDFLAEHQRRILAKYGCQVECCMCCLVEQRSGFKKFFVQPCYTLSASLVARGCSVGTFGSVSYCATAEEHWARLSEVKLQKLVLSVNRRSIEFSQVFNTGDWCLLPFLQDKVLPCNSLQSNFALERVEIDVEQPLISLQWRYALDVPLSHSNANSLQRIVSLSSETNSAQILHNLSEANMESTDCAAESEEDFQKSNLRRYSTDDTQEMSERTLGSEPQLVDVVLTLCNILGNEFRDWLFSLKRNLIPQTLSISEALIPSPSVTIPSRSGSNLGEICDTVRVVKLEASSGMFSLQGEVVSIRGKLETLECSKDSITTGDFVSKVPIHTRFSGCGQEQPTVLQLRDLYTNQLIKIHMNFDKYVRPVGFGPGAVACFRRILLRRDVNLLVGIPTTDVLIESVEKRNCSLLHNSQPLSMNSFRPQEQEGCVENIAAVDLLNGLICEMEPRKKYLKVHCRVVAVQELELEWQISRPLSRRKFSSDSLSVQDEVVRDIAVKWGCFIIDDGSALAECWAYGGQAAKFLGLHGLAGDFSTSCRSLIRLVQLSSHPGENQAGLGESLSQVFKNVVRRHKRVYVQGEPPQGDSLTASWLMKGIDGDLDETEALILRLVLEQACQRGPMVVHCATMNEENRSFKCTDECHGGQKLPLDSTMNASKPWQYLTWSRTKLIATKVEVLNTWAELQQLASSFCL